MPLVSPRQHGAGNDPDGRAHHPRIESRVMPKKQPNPILSRNRRRVCTTISIIGNEPISADGFSVKDPNTKRVHGRATLTVSGDAWHSSLPIYSKRSFATLKAARRWTGRLNIVAIPAE